MNGLAVGSLLHQRREADDRDRRQDDRKLPVPFGSIGGGLDGRLGRRFDDEIGERRSRMLDGRPPKGFTCPRRKEGGRLGFTL